MNVLEWLFQQDGRREGVSVWCSMLGMCEVGGASVWCSVLGMCEVGVGGRQLAYPALQL